MSRVNVSIRIGYLHIGIYPSSEHYSRIKRMSIADNATNQHHGREYREEEEDDEGEEEEEEEQGVLFNNVARCQTQLPEERF